MWYTTFVCLGVNGSWVRDKSKNVFQSLLKSISLKFLDGLPVFSVNTTYLYLIFNYWLHKLPQHIAILVKVLLCTLCIWVTSSLQKWMLCSKELNLTTLLGMAIRGKSDNGINDNVALSINWKYGWLSLTSLSYI